MSIRSPDEYREEARRMRAMAVQVSRDDMRQTLLEIAHLYEAMARQAKMLIDQKARRAE